MILLATPQTSRWQDLPPSLAAVTEFHVIMILPQFLVKNVNPNDSSGLSATTFVVFELPCSNLLLEHLVNFFKCPVLGLWDKEKHEDEDDHIRAEPNVSILAALQRSQLESGTDQEFSLPSLIPMGSRSTAPCK